MPLPADLCAEWLEADGLGGFASGTVGGVRTRRYHALLLVATTPPTGRFVLVNGFDAWLGTSEGTFALTTQEYTPNVLHPEGQKRLTDFTLDPWPTWTYRLEDGTRLSLELLVPSGMALVALRWRRLEGTGPATLQVRPFLSGRDYHAVHQENAGFRFDAKVHGQTIAWRPYPGVPGTVSLANAAYLHHPEWYRQFHYREEQARGLDCVEDLASPGILHWNLEHGPACWLLAAEVRHGALEEGELEAVSAFRQLEEREQRRRARFATPLHRAADAYLVQRGKGLTIIAGYPWFTDWGRDTFIAMRGLCLATGRLDDAERILLAWAGQVSQGMLPNRFPDRGEQPDFNAVDASLCFIIAVHDFLTAKPQARTRDTLLAAASAILEGYRRGTRHGIRQDSDGLLAAGEPGVQLTWMDAKVGDSVVTPRIGKPVEIQALWLNALSILGQGEAFERGRAVFRERFWNEAQACLHDVVDVDHVPGTVDSSIRPNQILAVGGLPLNLLEPEQARRVVETVESRLLTPLGLRTLAPDSPGYAPHCQGGVPERDSAYHQGTAWPWLLGPFVEAWLRVRENSPEAKREAQERFLQPLRNHLQVAGLGHITECADAESPFTPRGCPFQAWSLGEMLRLTLLCQ